MVQHIPKASRDVRLRDGTSLRVLPFGDRHLLIEPECDRAVQRVSTALLSSEASEWTEVVAAARAVLVELAPIPGSSERLVARIVEVLESDVIEDAPESSITIPVRYGGPDLEMAAESQRRTVPEFIAWHHRLPWRVAFCGFAPGFAYLVRDDHRLPIPRLPTPRISVPAGSVAMADGFCSVYPGTSPGGWRLIGTTEVDLWNVNANPPSPLAAGVTVRFEAQT